DLQGVFAEIATSAARLCDAYDAIILQRDGNMLRPVGHFGPIPTPGPLPLARGTVMGRTVLAMRMFQVADLQAASDDYPEGSSFAQSWTRFFAQGAKWNFCLTAGKIRPRIRRDHEEEGAADKAECLTGCKSLYRQLPVFGRLAYPGRAAATKHERLGRKKPHCPAAVIPGGGKDKGGSELWGRE